MRDLRALDRYRVELPADVYKLMGVDDATQLDPARNGAFVLPIPNHRDPAVIYRAEDELHVIAAAGGGWDHVSVSLEHRCPTWAEMEAVAKMFFADDEVAMQLHVPAKDRINNHPFVLHWWRPRSSLKPIPRPPRSYV